MAAAKPLTMFEGLVLPASADFHVHLRDGAMMEAVTPTIKQGGVDTVFVMPNLTPPITTVEHAISYQNRLKSLAPDVQFLMSLYLHSSITPSIIRRAKKSGVVFGVKSYPAGVTTNSSSGVVDYEAFYPVFKAMEEEDLVLNLHGEAPPSSGEDITVLNAEQAFLPTLLDLHTKFPKLRIVLEHCTTAAAVEAVQKCGSNVVGTITAHHLFLIVDDWAGDPINFCKPVAKTPSDRLALLRAATSNNPKFFFGSDSAPHLLSAKKGLTDGGLGAGKCAAGVFTQPHVTGFVLEAFELAVRKGLAQKGSVTKEALKGFLGVFGRDFYHLEQSQSRIQVKAGGSVAVKDIVVGSKSQGSMQDTVVTFRSDKQVYIVEWV